MSNAKQQVIAERLGLSRATVSRCFTNHAGISPVTRAKVFQVAAEIGYSHMAKRVAKAGKAKQQSCFSALICCDTEEYFHSGYESPGEQILAGVSEYAQLTGARVEVSFIPPEATDINDPAFDEIEGLKERPGRGVLLIYPFAGEVIEQLSLRFPVVSLVDQFGRSSIDCVDVDHHDGISILVNHLHAAGHRRIGFYTKQYPVEASWSMRRYSAFIEKMTRLKLKVSQQDVIGVFPRRPLTQAERFEVAVERSRDGVTAWVCAADSQAYDLIRALKKSGLKVPKDVSVTGFDGIQRTGSDPLLTTVQIPYREIGMSGAERLAARLAKRFSSPRTVYISGQLREGRTVGPARSDR